LFSQPLHLRNFAPISGVRRFLIAEKLQAPATGATAHLWETNMKRILIALALCTVLALSAGAGHANPQAADVRGTGNAAAAPPAATTTTYSLVAWDELGMHCMDGKDYSIFSVLPPYNTIHAQLIQKGEPPRRASPRL
jgi:hypothetical protein